VAGQPHQAGHTVELDAWDWAPGQDFVARMAAALQSANRLPAVCTRAYFTSTPAVTELRAAFAAHAATDGRVEPVLLEPVTLPPLYAPLIALDLTGLDKATPPPGRTAGWPGGARPAPHRFEAGPRTRRPPGVRRPPASRCGGCRRGTRGSTGRDGMLAELPGGCTPMCRRRWV
jgi:hypothetical protein